MPPKAGTDGPSKSSIVILTLINVPPKSRHRQSVRTRQLEVADAQRHQVLAQVRLLLKLHASVFEAGMARAEERFRPSTQEGQAHADRHAAAVQSHACCRDCEGRARACQAWARRGSLAQVREVCRAPRLDLRLRKDRHTFGRLQAHGGVHRAHALRRVPRSGQFAA